MTEREYAVWGTGASYLPLSELRVRIHKICQQYFVSMTDLSTGLMRCWFSLERVLRDICGFCIIHRE